MTLGPIELWALNTSVEDVILRDKLYKKIGPIATRALLAHTFPKGTARPLIEKRLNQIEQSKDPKATHDIIDELYAELLAQHMQEMLQKQ